jgi:Serine dehydrogenase proteinase
MGATIFYSGLISYDGYEKVTGICEHATGDSATLYLRTPGGSPDFAFRIARALRHSFKKKLTLVVPKQCKSAGTLIAIGATEIVIADRGELGPLDIQLAKKDELFEMGSGLDIITALGVVREEAVTAFQNCIVSLKNTGRQVSARMAAELAANLVAQMVSPLYQQIDPLRIAETQRSIAIAMAYGSRLDEYDRNLRPGALIKLITEYPSHGFVIDRKEAKQLFKSVRSTTDIESRLGEELCAGNPYDLNRPPHVIEVSENEIPNEATTNSGEGSGKRKASARNG